MRSWTKLLLCAVFSVLAGGAFGQPNLTDAQTKQLEEWKAQARVELRVKKAEIGVVEAQIRLALAAANPDLKAIGLLIDRKADLEAEWEKARLSHQVKVRQLVGDQGSPFWDKKAGKPKRIEKS